MGRCGVRVYPGLVIPENCTVLSVYMQHDAHTPVALLEADWIEPRYREGQVFSVHWTIEHVYEAYLRPALDVLAK